MSNYIYEMVIESCGMTTHIREIDNDNSEMSNCMREMVNTTVAMAVDLKFLKNKTSRALNRIPIVQECDARMLNSDS